MSVNDYPSSILRLKPTMKIGMVSLGCPKNLVDSEVMLGLAQQAGHQLTRDAADADVLVVNTCAFIDKAKQESIDTILEMAEHKKTGKCQRLVVTGCMAERYRDELRAQIPEIDAVLGTGEVPEIVNAIGGVGGSASTGPLAELGATSRCCARTANQSDRRPVDRRSRRPAHLHLRRRHAAPARHAAALRLREDRRRLRLQVRLLHHPHAARQLSQPSARLDRARGAGAGGARREGAAAHLAGHELLRRRPRRARRAGAAAARAERDRRPRVDPDALPLSDHHRRRRARRDGGEREGVQVHRPAAAACVGRAC